MSFFFGDGKGLTLIVRSASAFILTPGIVVGSLFSAQI